MPHDARRRHRRGPAAAAGGRRRPAASAWPCGTRTTRGRAPHRETAAIRATGTAICRRGGAGGGNRGGAVTAPGAPGQYAAALLRPLLTGTAPDWRSWGEQARSGRPPPFRGSAARGPHEGADKAPQGRASAPEPRFLRRFRDGPGVTARPPRAPRRAGVVPRPAPCPRRPLSAPSAPRPLT